MAGQDERIPTRPWPTVGIDKLRADASNHCDWLLCVLAVAQGQRAEKLLTQSPAANSDVENAQAALLKSFLMLTVHTSFRQAIAPMNALAAYKHLAAAAPQSSIYEVDAVTKVKIYQNHTSAAAYVAAHRERHDRLLSADATHYLASPPAYIADILAGLPHTPNAHNLRELYAFLLDSQKTAEAANRLISAVLRLPPPTRLDQRRVNSVGTQQHESRKTFQRPRGDPSITDYRCQTHMMDNYEYGGDICLRMQRKGDKRTERRKIPQPAAAATAVATDQNFVLSVAATLRDLYNSEISNDSNVNEPQQYLPEPLFDSAANNHFAKSPASFSDALPLHVDVRLANGTTTRTTSISNSQVHGVERPLPLRNVLCVPSLRDDLVSAGRLAKEYDVHLRDDSFYVAEKVNVPPPNVVATGTLIDGVYRFDPPQRKQLASVLCQIKPQLLRRVGRVPVAFKRAHEALGHVHPAAVARALRHNPAIRPLLTSGKGTYTCQPCSVGKLTRAPHRRAALGARPPLTKLSTDTAGPLSRSTRGNKYFTVLADAGSGYLSALPAPSKAASGQMLAAELRRLQRASGRPIVRLHSDDAPELCSGAPKRFADANGIRITTATPNTPQMNGAAERAIRTLKDCIRTQLAAAKLANAYWDYALEDCVAKRNATPTRNSIDSPHKQLFRESAPLPLLLPFGAVGYVPNKSRSLSLFTPRGLLCRYLAPTSRATVKVLQTSGRKELDARAADFVEATDSTKNTRSPSPRSSCVPNRTSFAEPLPRDEADRHTSTLQAAPTALPIKRSLRPRGRLRKPPRFRDEPDAASVTAEVGSSEQIPTAAAIAAPPGHGKPPPDPRTLHQARQGQFGPFWEAAHDAFIDRSLKLGTWKLVDPLPDDKQVPFLWVYHRKTDAAGNLCDFSARCTARGDLIKAGTHFDPLRTAAQSPSHNACRLMYARAALAGEEIRGVDAPGAYPRPPADPNFRVTMRQPRRSSGAYTAPGKVVLLDKAQMGSPDGSFLWEQFRNDCLRKWGWKQLKSEPSCFLYKESSSSAFVRQLADTDDMLLTSNSSPLMDSVIAKLKREWDITEERPLQQHMGIAVQHDKNGVRLSVRKNVEELLAQFGLMVCNSCSLPHEPKADLSVAKTDESPLDDAEKRRYGSAIGVARFLADTVLYEIAYITSQLAWSLNRPTARHWRALKHRLRYLAGRSDAELYYKHAAGSALAAYCDSDWAACRDTRRSRTGIAVKYAGDLVHWRSKLQSGVTLSSAEAEYFAASEAARVLVWVKLLAEEWLMPLPQPLTLDIDNAGAVKMSVANGVTTRSKHIDTRAHYVNEHVQKGTIATKRVPETAQLADTFTKPLAANKFRANLALIRQLEQGAARG